MKSSFCSLLVVLALAAPFCPSRATAVEPIPAPAVKIDGAQATETNGEITGLAFTDGKLPTEADLTQMRAMPHLKALSFGRGLNDDTLKGLAGLPALERFVCNGMQVTDEGFATLATMKTLRNVTLFHPGKGFHGASIAALAALPNLEGLSIGGTSEFADPGMADLAKLTHLKELRIWHTGVTVEGMKSLASLKELRSLTVGQRLSLKPPVALNDDTVAVIAGLPALESLTLQEARLSLDALAKLKQIPTLKRLTLDSIDLPDADVAELRKQLPKAEIKWTAPTDDGKRRIEGLFGAR